MSGPQAAPAVMGVRSSLDFILVTAGQSDARRQWLYADQGDEQRDLRKWSAQRRKSPTETALKDALTTYIEGGTFDDRNVSGLPDQRRRYRVQRVQADPQPWGRLHFTVTRTDRIGDDDFLTFWIHVGTVPLLGTLKDAMDR